MPPLHPKSTRSLLYAAFGAFAGAFITFTFFIVRSALFGIKASEANLKANGLHVSGEITSLARNGSKEPLMDRDLDTIRRMVAYVTSGAGQGGQSLLLLNGLGVDYSSHLAEVLAKRHLKVMVLPISFKSGDKGHQEGRFNTLKVLRRSLRSVMKVLTIAFMKEECHVLFLN